MLLELIFLKLPLSPFIAISILLIASLASLNHGESLCSNKIVIGVSDFNLEVNGFLARDPSVVEGYRVLIHIEPGESISRSEESPLVNVSQNYSLLTLFVTRQTGNIYRLKLRNSLINSSATIDGLMSMNESNVVFNNYTFVLETKQYRDFLAANLTVQFVLTKLNTTVKYFRTSRSQTGWFINLSLNNAVVGYEQLVTDNDLNVLFPFKPLLQDSAWLNMLISGMLDKLTYNYTITGSYAKAQYELYSPAVNIQINNDLYTIKITPNLVINLSRAKYVEILTTDVSAKTVGNGTLSIDLKIRARGIGGKMDVAIRNVLINAIYLSKIYGCFKLETIGLRITVDNVPLSYVDRDLDVDRVIIEEIDGSSLGFKTNMVLIALIATLSASTIVALILTKRLGSRSIRLKHT